MRPEQVNLNTSLGPLMSEQDLAEALRQGKVKAAEYRNRQRSGIFTRTPTQ